MIRGELVGDQAIVFKLNGFAPAFLTNIEKTIQRLSIKLSRDVKANKLSGQVLKVKTGTLRRSIDWNVSNDGGKVVGKVSTNLKYGRAHEFGFQGEESVRAHIRTITQAFGKQIPATEVNVSEHSRRVNLPARSFLRSALADMLSRGELQSAIDDTIAQTLKGTFK